MPRTEPRLTCGALFLILFGSVFLCLGVAGTIWKPAEERWEFWFVVGLSSVLIVAGIGTTMWRIESNHPRKAALEMLQFDLALFSRWGCLLSLLTVIVFPLSILVLVFVFEWMGFQDDDALAVIAPFLAIFTTGAFFITGGILLMASGRSIFRSRDDDAEN